MGGLRWLGVDVSKADLTAGYRQGGDLVVVNVLNTLGGFRRLLKTAGHWDAVCLEPTGPYWKHLAAWLDAQGIPLALGNPREVRDFAKGMGQRSKTDPIDARVLVRFAEVRELEPRPVSDPLVDQIRSLSRTCEALQEDLNRMRDRIEKAEADPATPRATIKALDAVARSMGKQIVALEEQIQLRIAADPELSRVQRRLRSIKGIGPKTARVLVAEYGRGLLWASPGQLVGFAGLDVVLTESGVSVHKLPRISKKGNWRIRRALFLAALTAIVHNPLVSAHYQRLVNRGVAKKAALVAAMRKLLHLCHGVIKNDRPFDPDFAVGAVGGAGCG